MKKMMHKIIKAFSYVKTKFRLSRVRVDFSRGLKLEKNVSFFTDGSGEISFLGTAVVRALTEIRVADHASVTFGNGCFVNRNCMIISHDNITVGSGVMIGPNVMIYDHDHNYKAGGGVITSPVVIGNNVWIGAGVIILRGAVIGDNSVIAAGSIVKGVIPQDSLFYNRREVNIKSLVE